MKLVFAAIFSTALVASAHAQVVDAKHAATMKTLRDQYLKASCGTLLIAKSDPEFVKGDAISIFDALLYGAAMGSLNIGDIIVEYRKSCSGYPDHTVEISLRSAVKAVEMKQFGGK